MFSNIIGKIERRDHFLQYDLLNSLVFIGFSFRDCESASDHFNAQIHLKFYVHVPLCILFHKSLCRNANT